MTSASVDGATGMLSELLAHPGVVEEVVLRSRFGFMAFHGGNLEVGTDQIAAAAADAAGASLYVVRQPDDLRWHVPSVAFRPEESPALAAFVDHVGVVVTVHGYGRMDRFTHVLLGGRNRELARHVAGELRARLSPITLADGRETDYAIVDDLDDIPPELRGLHPANPVNRPPAAGVQLELPPRVRGNGPFWAEWDHGTPVPHATAVAAALAAAAQSWPL